jgi:hypothetical protein
MLSRQGAMLSRQGAMLSRQGAMLSRRCESMGLWAGRAHASASDVLVHHVAADSLVPRSVAPQGRLLVAPVRKPGVGRGAALILSLLGRGAPEGRLPVRSVAPPGLSKEKERRVGRPPPTGLRPVATCSRACGTLKEEVMRSTESGPHRQPPTTGSTPLFLWIDRPIRRVPRRACPAVPTSPLSARPGKPAVAHTGSKLANHYACATAHARCPRLRLASGARLRPAL